MLNTIYFSVYLDPLQFADDLRVETDIYIVLFHLNFSNVGFIAHGRYDITSCSWYLNLFYQAHRLDNQSTSQTMRMLILMNLAKKSLSICYLSPQKIAIPVLSCTLAKGLVIGYLYMCIPLEIRGTPSVFDKRSYPLHTLAEDIIPCSL